MKSRNRWHSIVALVIVTCMLAVPVSALGKKGKDAFNRGMKYEQAQQWEKAAQEFTLAIAADPSNVDYQLHYRRATFNASQTFMTQGRSLAEQRDGAGTPANPSNARPQEPVFPTKTEPVRVVNWNGDLKQFIRKMADELQLNV